MSVKFLYYKHKYLCEMYLLVTYNVACLLIVVIYAYNDADISIAFIVQMCSTEKEGNHCFFPLPVWFAVTLFQKNWQDKSESNHLNGLFQFSLWKYFRFACSMTTAMTKIAPKQRIINQDKNNINKNDLQYTFITSFQHLIN
jgi:hypothetical protein